MVRVAVTRFVAASNTDTVPAAKFAMYMNPGATGAGVAEAPGVWAEVAGVADFAFLDVVEHPSVNARTTAPATSKIAV